MKTLTFTILFSLLSFSHSHAMTGNEWMAMCKQESNSSRGICLGYLNGLRDMYEGYSYAFKVFVEIDGKNYPKAKTCMPINVELGQLKNIVTKWLNEHPEKLHDELRMQYIMMVNKIFPCSK